MIKKDIHLAQAVAQEVAVTDREVLRQMMGLRTYESVYASNRHPVVSTAANSTEHQQQLACCRGVQVVRVCKGAVGNGQTLQLARSTSLPFPSAIPNEVVEPPSAPSAPWTLKVPLCTSRTLPVKIAWSTS